MSEPLKSTILLKHQGRVEHAFWGASTPAPMSLARVHQTHSADIIELRKPWGELLPKADGLFTYAPDQWIGIQTADCLPVLFYSLVKPAVSAIHAGWRGLNQGILIKQVELFDSRGIRPQDLIVVIGPSIGPCCFEVSQETLQSILKNWEWMWAGTQPPWSKGRGQYLSEGELTEATATFAPRGAHDLWVDLRSIARWQLKNAGVKESLTDDVSLCTYCGTLNLAGQKFKAETNDFASHRRATHSGQKAGRQWSGIRLLSQPSTKSSECG